MSQRRRWTLDELVDVAREHGGPRPGAAERGWRELEAALESGGDPPDSGLEPGPSPVEASSTAASGSAGIVAAKVVTGAALAVSIAIGVAVVRSEPADSRDRASSGAQRPTVPIEEAEAATSEPRPPASALATEGASVSTPPPGSAEPPREPAIKAPRRRPRRGTDHPKPAVDSLVEQVQLLGRAWGAVERGDADRALAWIREHEERFPESPLAQERDACRLVVGCLRRDEGATDMARSFLRLHGEGAVARRVQRACTSGDDESTMPATKHRDE